jgi:hypothetical protein
MEERTYDKLIAELAESYNTTTVVVNDKINAVCGRWPLQWEVANFTRLDEDDLDTAIFHAAEEWDL